ncbi:MAG TPA: prephenate dehydrogenase/arogenate dehydrogenase family protein [Candidatus Manganitrophaceae bacterium]|nr:prephenate dehydrogenase/arogenate dehydrogenase family protein [Bacteroidota bacterium]
MKKRPLLLVGYGRFGKYAASILRRHFDLHVLETRKNVRPGRGIRRVGNADIPRFSIILLAIPVHRLRGFLKQHSSRVAPGSFVADVCAVKEKPLEWMDEFLPDNVSFSGLHPLFGPDSARQGLRGHAVVVCRGRTTSGCHRKLLTIIKKLGLKSIETDPGTHDRTIASTLFMTQWIGRWAASCGLTRHFPFETPAFNSLRILMSRAGNDAPALLRDIYRYSPYSRRIVKKLRMRAKKIFPY